MIASDTNEASAAGQVAGAAGPTPQSPHPPLPSFERDLPPEERKLLHARIKDLSVLQPWRTFLVIAFDWAIIIATIAAMNHWRTAWVYLAGIVVIATRQHGLLVIGHEAAHYRLLQNRRWNDLLGNLLCAWPTLLTTVEAYRANHLQHHWFTNSTRDPDWMRKLGKPGWSFPRRATSIYGSFILQAVGAGLLDMVAAVRSVQRANEVPNAVKAPKNPYRLIFMVLLLGSVFATGNGKNFLLYWVVPLVTVLTCILRVRSVAEHFGLEYDHELRQTRTVLVGPLEKFLFGQHNVNYHLEHHCYPSVPWYRLPALRAALQAVPAYRENAHVNTSYFLPSARPFAGDLIRSDATEHAVAPT